MAIAAAVRDDCHAVATIHVESWRAAYASILPADYLASLSVPDREASWISILETSASRTLVAKRDGDTLGFVTFGHCRDQGAAADRGEIWALYVAPRAWSEGVGRALWDAARVVMLQRDFVEASLWVLSGNARGLHFYELLGFRPEPQAAQYFERGGVRFPETRLVRALLDSMSAR